MGKAAYIVRRWVELYNDGTPTAIWSATVAVDSPSGLPIKAGSRVQIRMATFTEVINGLIVRQHEYISNLEVI